MPAVRDELMTNPSFSRSDDLLAEAADWVVRLEGKPDDTEALVFDAWLEASSDHAQAFDAVLRTAHGFVRHRDQLASLKPERAAHSRWGRWAILAGGAAAAAAIAVAVTPQIMGAQTQVYETARGEHRQISLADGTSLHLSGATRLSVRLKGNSRNVVLDSGEAVFDVAHDVNRPFFVAAGDRTVRVVGTQFDVRRLSGKISVTVARGAVEVRPNIGAGMTYRLRPGQKLDHQEGQSAARVVAAEPSEVMGWRSGRLVLRDKALGDVVDDLNQQFAVPMTIEDASLAALPVSGVLVLDSQDAVIRRLALLAPVKAVRSDAGLLLRRDTDNGR